jgi:ubiquinone/menaquinone biosynthesis C-methylase UbiE
MTGNFWDELMGDDEHAASYMATYGEGPGSDTRNTLEAFINDGESLLDVGCGPGWNMDHFAQSDVLVSKYKGVDYSKRFVRVANKRLKDENTQMFTDMEILRFQLQDCRALKEKDNTWDVVLVQDCVEHTNCYEIPTIEALRVAKRRAIVTFWHLTVNDDHINDDGNDGYGAWYSRPKWEAFLNTMPYVWFHVQSKPTDNRQHDFYIIDKELKDVNYA